MGYLKFIFRKVALYFVFHLQLLFQMCICTSSVPESFLWDTTSSILKRGKSPADCSSCRPITVSCNISKLFEYINFPHHRFVNFFLVIFRLLYVLLFRFRFWCFCLYSIVFSPYFNTCSVFVGNK